MVVPKMFRSTRHINRRVTQSIFRGFDYSNWTGRHLNTYAVLHLLDLATSGPQKTFHSVRHRFRDWLAYAAAKRHLGQQTADYAFAFENKNGLVHVNWVVHIPPALYPEFELKLPRWLAKAQGACRPFDIDIQRVAPVTAKRLAKYIVKGTDPKYIDHFHLGDLATDQGVISGIRAGLSRSIGPTSRREAGFKAGMGRVRRGQVSPATTPSEGIATNHG